MPTTPLPADQFQSTVIVPLCELGLGTGTAAVRDARTREVVWFRLAGSAFKLVGVVACVELPCVCSAGHLRLVGLPGGREVWVVPYDSEGVRTVAGDGSAGGLAA
jgi:hypothetical protein